ncbi:PCRF domain-containing protein [bacterium]|nr:PCRF domain-containing protein [bacterium]
MSSIIIEIRAGAGGEESALFANDLFRMYQKYAQSKNWELRVLDAAYSPLGGLRRIIFEIKGADTFSKLKYEAGVHRVQRVPKTEKGNRIHTSTVSVAVLPTPKPTQVKIKPSDIKMDFFKASGPGGQYVNKRQTGVRITHLPTGTVVSSQSQRSLEANKKAALDILVARLFKINEEKERAKMELKRRTQIGQAQRAEKIRTYNFPQDRVTDHRIKKSWHNIEKIMAGNLEPIIKKLEKNLS